KAGRRLAASAVVDLHPGYIALSALRAIARTPALRRCDRELVIAKIRGFGKVASASRVLRWRTRIKGDETRPARGYRRYARKRIRARWVRAIPAGAGHLSGARARHGRAARGTARRGHPGGRPCRVRRGGRASPAPG